MTNRFMDLPVDPPSIEAMEDIRYNIEAAVRKVLYNQPVSERLPLLITATQYPMAHICRALETLEHMTKYGSDVAEVKTERSPDHILILAGLLLARTITSQTNPIKSLKIAIEDLETLEKAGRI